MIRFGILGAGNIAHRFAASLAHEPRATLVAASRRTAQKAEAFLAEVPHEAGARAYGSHQQLIDDPCIDAVYVALPHDLHEQWCVKALQAGKAVLCEKPAAINANQMSRIAKVSREQHVLFMEAMKPRFTQLYSQVLVAMSEIGSLRRVEASLCNDMLADVSGAQTYHMKPGPGAGVLLDCGTYCASWIVECSAAIPQNIVTEATMQSGIDIYVDATMRMGTIKARLECAFDRAKPRQAILTGERGRIVVDDLHRPQRGIVEVEGIGLRKLEAPYKVDDFFGEISHFVDLLEHGQQESTIMSLDDSVRCARLLDAIRDSI